MRTPMPRLSLALVLAAAALLACPATVQAADARSFRAVDLTRLEAMRPPERRQLAEGVSDVVVRLDTLAWSARPREADVEAEVNRAVVGWPAGAEPRIWIAAPLPGLEDRSRWQENMRAVRGLATNGQVHGVLFQGPTTLGMYDAAPLVDALEEARPGIALGQFSPRPAIGFYWWGSFYRRAAEYPYAPPVLVYADEVRVPPNYPAEAHELKP